MFGTIELCGFIRPSGEYGALRAEISKHKMETVRAAKKRPGVL
jgi:hypothetical protein